MCTYLRVRFILRTELIVLKLPFIAASVYAMLVCVFSARAGGLENCTSGDFACGDGRCVPRSVLCDHKPDCMGGEDEQNCGELGPAACVCL